jgi:glutathione S-transferase
MPYTLYVGNKRYSSWSMRPWVALKALDIPFDEVLQIFKPGLRQLHFRAFSPSGKVPCLHDDDGGAVVWDSLAIIEYLAEQFPKLWPQDRVARAFARSAAAEMHSGFRTLCNECSMNVGLRIDLGSTRTDALDKELARLSELFNDGLTKFGGPWLAGKDFSAVDAFFAPVASRCTTYGLELQGPAAEYLSRLFEHPAVQAWIVDGIKETAREPTHEDDCVREGRTILEDLSEKIKAIEGA